MPRKEGGQRQSQHMPHRNIKEYQQQPDADPKAPPLAAGRPRRGQGGGAARGARRAGAVAGSGDGGADFRLGELSAVIIHQHAVLH